MFLELLGIYAAYKAADRYNNLKEEELKQSKKSNLENEVKELELKIKKLEYQKRLEELDEFFF